MSAEATKMQDLASEFSKIFRGNTPGAPQREEKMQQPAATVNKFAIGTLVHEWSWEHIAVPNCLRIARKKRFIIILTKNPKTQNQWYGMVY